MNMTARPVLVQTFVLLLIVAGGFTAYFGLSASGYLIPALCLFLQAGLLWWGRGLSVFVWIMLINLASGLLLVLVLWLGDGLGHMKLNISGVSLLINLLCGGPLMFLLSVPLLALLRFDEKLPTWFRAHGASVTA